MDSKIIKVGPTNFILKNEISINRLFLIGNGFDISLGLKTKYTDFLLWLLKKELFNATESANPNEDRDSQIKYIYKSKLFSVFFYDYSKRYTIRNSLQQINDLLGFFNYLKNNKIEIKSRYSKLLFDKLLNSLLNSTFLDQNWVNIEKDYFELLKYLIRGLIKNKDEINLRQQAELTKTVEIVVDNLNDELTEIVVQFKEYLKTLKINIKMQDAQKYIKHFNEELYNDDFLDFDLTKENILKAENYFLNFNYTDSITNLLSHFKEFQYRQNFIHGNLQINDDEIIFGFGDEMDSSYKEMEELNDNRLFKHIKSFQYFKTSSQRKLQTFLNSGYYQVYIYGHSCGLSDRVMLNEIFEHTNCKSIKVFYYNDEDFTTKTMEISRHFNSNQLMRKRIVNKNIDCLIPQIKG
ncbi:MAG: AbiH family protein [Fusobacteriaceae bacterium]